MGIGHLYMMRSACVHAAKEFLMLGLMERQDMMQHATDV
jgi:hypothetical protein